MSLITASPNGEFDGVVSLVGQAESVRVKPAEGRHGSLRKAIS